MSSRVGTERLCVYRRVGKAGHWERCCRTGSERRSRAGGKHEGAALAGKAWAAAPLSTAVPIASTLRNREGGAGCAQSSGQDLWAGGCSLHVTHQLRLTASNVLLPTESLSLAWVLASLWCIIPLFCTCIHRGTYVYMDVCVCKCVMLSKLRFFRVSYQGGYWAGFRPNSTGQVLWPLLAHCRRALKVPGTGMCSDKAPGASASSELGRRLHTENMYLLFR